MLNILKESNSFEEYTIKCVINGINERVYKGFIYNLASSGRYRQYGEKLMKKVRLFRYQLVTIEVENGERSKEDLWYCSI